ncbi:hypothetical protein [Gracilibacillus sp. YIM 98692]|uniref:hypothetical protein n=1 Tax=Gracilibacillus sp. YIM 98692 TaxID=2663532 RepID=UPI0013D0508A|nr:hypothetical protein [Gracilibacillus sp. YIM 98692]
MRYVYLIISVLFIFGLDLWVENSPLASKFYDNLLRPIMDEGKIHFIWLIATVVILSIIWRKQVIDKNDNIQNLKNKLNSEMEILIQANMQLSKYRLKDNISVLLNNFVKSHSYAIAVQMYEFQEIKVNRKTIYKITLDEGVVTENININAVQQIYYRQRTSVINQFEKAQRLSLENDNPNPLLDFVLDTYSHLNNFTPHDENEEDAVLCSLMFLGLEILEKDYDLGIDSLGDNEEQLRSLMDNYKTGILRGALMRDAFYTFTHIKENDKYNRQYITRLVNVRGNLKLFLIALDASILDDEVYNSIMTNISEGFENLLIDLENMYNNSIERIGD